MPGVHVDRGELARLHGFGLSASQIATRLGCTQRTVVRWRKEAGVAANASRRVSAELLDAARRMFDGGASRKDVSQTLGVSERTLRKYLPELRWTAEECAEYRAMVRQLNRIGAVA